MIILFVILVVGCGTPKTRQSRSPVVETAKFSNNTDTIIHYIGFTVSYNPKIRQPNWVSYTLTSEQVELTRHTPKIPRRFMPDPNLNLPQASNDDYKNSGWVKGHMARRQDMKWSEQAVLESDYFTNICPQNKEMNDGVWHKIENTARKVAETYDSVCIVCGPVFTNSVTQTIGVNKVPIPDYYFKAFLIKHVDSYYSIAFLCPNNTSVTTIDDVICSVNFVETLSGLDLFDFLNNSIEEKVESLVEVKLFMDVGK